LEGALVSVLHSAVSRKSKDDTIDRLLEDIEEIKLKIQAAESHFSEITDGDLIEANIYEIKSLNSRYRYLLREAKRVGATKDLSEVIKASEIRW
jgi:DNA-binding transcriptional ArsR family regulator